MTDGRDEYGEILRRALHAEAETVVPAADGLDRIRARVKEQPPRFGWSWFTAGWARPAMAGAAAVIIAAVAVSAPPAISTIVGVGGKGTPEQGGRSQGQVSDSMTGSPANSAPPQIAGAPTRSPEGSSTTASMPAQPGGPGCGEQSVETAASSPGAESPPPVQAYRAPCPPTAGSERPTTPVTTEPESTQPAENTSTEPAEQPTTNTTDESAVAP